MRRRTTLPAITPEQPGATSLERGLQILRCFNAAEQVLGTSEIAARLGIPKATALRLLETLVDAQYLARSGSPDRFSIDRAAVLLGQAFLSGSALARKARPVLQAFADQYRCHALLCVPRPEGMLTLLYQHGKGIGARPRLGPGTVFPPETTAVGHAWLWTQGPQTHVEFLARLRRGEGEGSGAGAAADLFQSFHDLERGGVCTVVDPRRGVRMSAIGVHAGSTGPAVIGAMSHLTGQDDAASLRSGLRDAAEKVSDVLLFRRETTPP